LILLNKNRKSGQPVIISPVPDTAPGGTPVITGILAVSPFSETSISMPDYG